MNAQHTTPRQRKGPRGPQPYPFETTTVRIPADLKPTVVEMVNRFKANALNLAGRKNKRINP